MTNTTDTLTNALFRIDPTQGLVEYTEAIKPYHSKLVEVLIEYVYKEAVNVSIAERYSWVIEFTRPDKEITYSCGFGHVWSPYGSNQLDTFPLANIIQSLGEIVIDAAVSVGSPNVNVPYNNIGYTFSVGDEIFFSTDGTLPVTTAGAIVAGKTYYVKTATTTVITVAETFGGTALSFTNVGTGTLHVCPQNLPFNSFLVEQSVDMGDSVPPKFEITVSSTTAKQLSFVGVNTCYDVDSLTKKWFVTGDITSQLTVGDTIFVNSDSGAGANGKYTIASFAAINSGTNTEIVVVEPISQLAMGDGTLNTLDTFAQIPGWATGTAVKLTSDNIFPSPLSSAATYYFVPTPKVGVFNLAKKRYPTAYDDFIPITTLGDGVLQIERAEPFVPGASVLVSGSYYSRNDVEYIVREVQPEGSNFRIHVAQKIRQSTPATESVDGFMRGHWRGYDEPQYCAVADAPDLHADTFIHETLNFLFTMSLRDDIFSSAAENQATGGFGIDEYASSFESPYGIQAENPHTSTAVTSGQSGAGTHVLLPMGYDTVYFDFGGLEENLASVAKNYGQTV